MNRGVYGLPRRAQTYQTYDPFCPPAAPSALDDEFDRPGVGIPGGWASVGASGTTYEVAQRRLIVSGTGTTDMRALEKVLPAGSFSAITRVSFGDMDRFKSYGMYVRSTASGLILANKIMYQTGNYADTICQFEKWSSFTTRSTFGNTHTHFQNSMFLRMRYDGTTIYCDLSVDGLNWDNMFNEAVTTYFTSGNLPDRVGLQAVTYDGNTCAASFDFFRYSPSATAVLGREVSVLIP